MKLPGWGVLIACLVGIVLLVWPVHADAIHAVRTHVFFEKDGAPYNESITYTFKCFGMPGYPAESFHGTDISVIYQYSATCSEYGCAVWQPDTHDWMYNFDHCELQGESLGMNFTIRNISAYSSCNEIPTQSFYPGEPWNSSEPYYWTPEAIACERHGRDISDRYPSPHTSFETCDTRNDLKCMELFDCTPPVRIVASCQTRINNTDLDEPRYRLYLDTCDPRSDQNCPGWVVDGMPLKMNPVCRVNTTSLPRSINPCWRFLVKVNRTLVFPDEEWERNRYQTDWLPEICSTKWTIPSDNKTVPDPENNAKTFVPKSPVESLFCNILQYLGGRCE